MFVLYHNSGFVKYTVGIEVGGMIYNKPQSEVNEYISVLVLLLIPELSTKDLMVFET